MWAEAAWEDIPSSETVHGVPRTHWGCHLYTFDWSVVRDAPAKRRAVLGFMDRHEEGEIPHLLLLGREGAGKTHLGIGLFRWAVYRTDLSRAAFVHVPSFSQDLKASFDASKRGAAPDDPFDRLHRTDLVVLDDPFGRNPTAWELDQVIPRLVDDVYMRGASLVVAANQDLDEFRARLHRHELSRIMDRAVVVRFFDEDDHRMTRSRT